MKLAYTRTGLSVTDGNAADFSIKKYSKFQDLWTKRASSLAARLPVALKEE
ncbi:MAG: hypothetical protein WBE34_15150 [Candidatus Nitrosopolaris sp.]